VDRLELRQLLTVTPTVWDIAGGDAGYAGPADSIVVEVCPTNPAKLQAVVDGEVVGRRLAARVSGIDVEAGRGHDKVVVDLGDYAADIPVTVSGGTGNDLLLGGLGRQVIRGEAGNDTIEGGAGDDKLDGGVGNDELTGDDGDDRVNGAGGRDTLTGGWGDDRLLGGWGDDRLAGGADADDLDGQTGLDTLKGGDGADELDGGLGDERDVIYADEPTDHVARDPVDVTKRDSGRLPLRRLDGDAALQQARVDRAAGYWKDNFDQEAPWYWEYAYRSDAAEAGVMADAAFAGSGSGGGGPNPPTSDTNVQTPGVDEADLVETDGRYLYAFRGGEWTADPQVVITAVGPDDLAARARVVAHIDVRGSTHGMYLHGDRLTILATEYDDQSTAQLVVTVYDVSDPASPGFLKQTKLDGYLYDSRMVEGKLYAVVTNYTWVDGPEVIDRDGSLYYESEAAYRARLAHDPAVLGLPGYTARVAAAGPAHTGDLLDGGATFVNDNPEAADENTLTSVVMLDTDAAGADPIATTTVTGWGGTLYASRDALYLLSADWTDTAIRTDIFKFHMGVDAVPLVASGHVTGVVNNQFSADQRGDYLRVATTENNWATNEPTTSSVYVMKQLADELNTVGGVTGIAPGEQIYATRFVGDRAYVVTFERTDPLWVLDLAEPAHPSIMGELQIPGFSRYLQPIDETHLLGIGRGADADGRAQGVQLSLFDVTDATHPRRVDTYQPPRAQGEAATWSDAEWEHHAFNYIRDKHALAFPFGTYDQDTGLWQDRLEVVNVDFTTGLSQLGAVQHEPDDWVTRSVRIGKRIFSIGTTTIRIADLDHPSTLLQVLTTATPQPDGAAAD